MSTKPLPLPLQISPRNAALNEASKQWLPATLKSGSVVTGFVLITLAAYGQNWALIPVLTGALLAGSLLGVMDWFIRRAFTPERAWAAKRKLQQKRLQKKRLLAAKKGAMGDSAEKKTRGYAGGAMLMGFALIKYPLVAVLIWALTRVWNLRAIMAFTGGFVLIHLVIALRAMGRVLFVSETVDLK